MEGRLPEVIAEGRLLVEAHLQLSRVGRGEPGERGVTRGLEVRGKDGAHALELLRDEVGVVPHSGLEALGEDGGVLDGLCRVHNSC